MATTAIGVGVSGAVREPVGTRPGRKAGTAWLFLFPSLVGVLVFLLIPVVLVFILSFAKWNVCRECGEWGGL